MPEDRGGLQYDIEIRDRFSRDLLAFRNGVRSAVADLRALRRDLGRTVGGVRAAGGARRSVNPARQAQADARAAAANARAEAANAKAIVAQEKRAATEIRARAQARQEELRVQRAQLALAQAQSRVEREAARAQIARSSAQAAEARRLAAVERTRQTGLRANIQQGRIAEQELRIQRQREAFAQRALRANQRASRSTRSYGRELRNVVGQAQRAVPIFNGMFGAILTAEAVRGSLGLVRDFIGEIIRSSAQIEDATLGIASLFTAVGQIRTLDGELATGPEALNKALDLAQDQVKQLRREALLVPATFEEVLSAFQVGLAPGLQAGLNVDEIRQVAIRISQAASAIQLPQNQLAEEIRSLLSANITARNTRIATSLGITNEDIRRARDAGVLFEFLTQRFEAFGTAAERATQNFTVRLSNLQDAISFLLQQGGTEFFQRVSDGIQAISDSLVSRTVFDDVIPNPDALQAVQIISEGLADAWQILVDQAAELGATDLPSTAKLIADGFRVVAEIIAGVADGIATVVGIFRKLGDVLGGLGLGSGGVRGLASFATVLAALGPVVRLISPLLPLLKGLWTQAVALGRALGPKLLSGLRSLVLSLTIRVGSAGGLLGALKGVGAALAGVGAAGAAVFGSLAVVGGIIAKLSVDIGSARRRAREMNEELTGDTVTSAAASFSVVREALNPVIQGLDGTAKAAAEARGELRRTAFDALIASTTIGDQLGEAFRTGNDRRAIELFRVQTDAANGFGDALARLVTEFDADVGAAQRFANALGTDTVIEFVGQLQQGQREAKTLRQVLDQAFLAGPALEFDLEEPIKKAQEQAKQLREDLAVATGDAVSFRTTAGVDEKLAEIAEKRQQAQLQVANATEQELAARQQLADLGVVSVDGLLDAQNGIDSTNKLLQITQAEIARISKQQLQITSGDPAEFARLGSELERLTGKAAGLQTTIEVIQEAQARWLEIVPQQYRDQAIEAIDALIQAQGRLNAATADAAAAASAERDVSAARQRLVDLELQIEATKELEGAIKKLQSSQQQLADAQRELALVGAPDSARRASEIQSERQQIDQQIADLTAEQRKLREETTTAALETGNLDTQNAIAKSFQAQNQALNNQVSVLQARGQILDAQGELLGLQRQRDEIDLRQEQLQTTQELAQAEAELALVGEDDRTQRLGALQVLLDGGRQRIALLRQELALLQQQREARLATAQDDATRSAINAEVDAQQFQLNAEIQKAELGLQALQLGEQKLRLQVESPIQFGIVTALQDLERQFDAFQTTVEITKSIVQGFADFASNAIVDAFDPTKQVDIKERFARLLQDIARQILQTFIQLAIVRSLLGAGLGGGLVGLNSGGPVPSVGGFASGGTIPRPAGLHPSDTVNAWLTPGEYVLRKSAVATAGVQFLESLNRGDFRPDLIGSRRRVSRVRPKRGYAEGGSVAPPPSSPGVIHQPVLLADSRTLEQLNNGGKRAYRDTAVANRRTFQAISAGGAG